MISIICRLAAFYEGGISYEYMRNAPLAELMMIKDEAEKLTKEREQANRKARSNRV